jgi:hypothetical protein
MSSVDLSPLQRSLSSVLAFWDRSTHGVWIKYWQSALTDKCWHCMINMAWFSLISRYRKNGLHYDVKTEEVALCAPTPKPRLEGFRWSATMELYPLVNTLPQ